MSDGVIFAFFYHEVFCGVQSGVDGAVGRWVAALFWAAGGFFGVVGGWGWGWRGFTRGRTDSWTPPTPSAPTEGHVSRAVTPFLHQWLVKLSAGSRVDAGPAVFAIVLQAGDVGTEEGGKLAPTACPLALVAHLVVQDVRFDLHPFVDVIVLQLNEASADGSDVALLIGEGHTASSLWVFELRVRVDASIANTSVQPVHNHSQFHCTQGPWHPPNKDSLAGIQRLGAIHDKVTVAQVPGTDLDRFVFDGWTGYTQVEFSILLNAGVNQSLNRGFFLEKQEGIAFRGEVGFALSFVGPVYNQVPIATKTVGDFIFIYVRGEASNKDLPGVALHPFSVLTAGWRVQAWSQGGVTVAIVEETVFKGKKTGTAIQWHYVVCSRMMKVEAHASFVMVSPYHIH